MKIYAPQISGSLVVNGTSIGNFNNLVSTSSFNQYTSSLSTGSFATTGSNTFLGNQTMSGSVIPAITNTYDLGDVTHQFRHLYLSSGSLYINGTKVLGATGQELQITTDVGQSLKILEAGSDTITLQSADGNITLATSGNGDVILDPTSGIIALKGTTTLYSGNKLLSSDGGAIQIGNDLGITGSIVTTGNINGINLTTFSSSIAGHISDINIKSGSFENKFNTLQTLTSSVQSQISRIQESTSSLNQFTASNSISSLNSYTSSLNTAIQLTGSTISFLGNIIVYGTQSIINSTNVELADNILYLAPTASIDNDLGIVGHYNDGTYRHAGIFMDASDGHSWKVFNGLQGETNATIDTAGTGFTLADFKAGAITGTSLSGQILASNGVVSSSYQITSWLPTGVVSGSSQLTSSYDARYVLSGSITQTTWDNIASKPGGIVSGSAQTIANLPTGTVSGSSQLTSSILATTGSNTFTGTQTISASLNISGSTNFGGAFAVNDANMNLTNSSSLNLTSGSGIYVNSPGVISGSISGIGSVTTYSASVSSQLTTLNTYTGSNDTKWSTLQTLTASNAASISQINSVTASLNTATSSYETKGRSIVSGSSQITFSGISSLPTLVSGSSQIDVMSTTNIAKLATTGSNTFNANQIISGSLSLLGPNATGTFFNAQNLGAGGATFTRVSASSYPYNHYIFNNGNVGIGITPQGAGTANTLEIGSRGIIYDNNDNFLYGNNGWVDAGTWKYKQTGYACIMATNGGQFSFSTAGSGTQNGAITWSDKFLIANNGNVSINTSGAGLLTLGASTSYGSVSSGAGGATIYLNGATRGGTTTAASNTIVVATDGEFYITNGAANSTKFLVGSTGIVTTGVIKGDSGADYPHSFTNTDAANTHWTNRSGRLLTSNGTNWVGDGKDPIMALVSGNNSTVRGNAIALAIHHEGQSDGTYSPMIAFSNKSNSGNYNTTYAAIMGKKTGQANDTNWSQGELHFFANPAGTYMGDTPNFLLSSTAATFSGTITESSSLRYKENVETIKYGLDKVLQMRGVTYNKKDNGVKEIGVIAEEIYDVLPEVVLKNEESEIDSVSYGRIVGVLIEAIKEQQKQIEELKALIK